MLVTEIKKVNKKTLDEWGTILAENQSTAFCLIGVVQNKEGGGIHMCLCKGISHSIVGEILRDAADEIDPEKKGGN